ncbi:MAG TPA: phasin family protein [Beijerinckia sp.]|jgi:phasin family protein|nr:phasin family protein [Beijerinckia sp.]
MAQQDARTTTGVDAAVESVNAASKNFQVLANELAQMSKQSFEHATQAVEKLRNARSLEEVLAIQTNFVKESFEQAAQRTRRLGELVPAFPMELAKTYQDAVLKSFNAAVQTTEAVGQAATANVERFSDSLRK